MKKLISFLMALIVVMIALSGKFYSAHKHNEQPQKVFAKIN